MTEPLLKLYLLGVPRLVLNGKPVSLERNKALALLAYLAVTGQPHSRESLATLLWPDYDQSRAYAYLRRTLWTINNTLGDQWVDTERDSLAIRTDTDFWLDIAQFEQLLAECEARQQTRDTDCDDCISQMQAAVSLYTGDFMAGFSLPDSADFDDWQFFQAESLQRKLASLLERLSGCQLRRKEPEAAIESAHRWLEMDSLNEAAHRQLMRCYAESGQRNAAMHQYQRCEQILKDQLGVAPQAETRALYDRIRAGQQPESSRPERPAIVEEQVPDQAADSTPNNLPAQPTAFIGRAEELDDIQQLFSNPACRLVTLLGPGGIGKTRLAQEIARLYLDGHRPAFPQGVYFIPLAPLQTADLLASAIADALLFAFHIEESEEHPQRDRLAQLTDYLRQRQMLLVLDNFEHLISGASLVSELLRQAPLLKILVTSRERLNIRGEWAFEIQGMRFPDAGQTDGLEDFSAARLFLQSAQQVQVGFAPSPQDRIDIARICRLVEGFPLAIELAAAWVRLLSCHEIANEIEKSLDFLADSVRDLPERHQSLRAVFEHSWRLLPEPEQQALRVLSIFRGEFSRQAAEQIAGATLLGLSSLVDKSLLRRNIRGRYEMHELLKQYAREKLSQEPERFESARQAHADYFTGLLAGCEHEFKTDAQLQALRAVEPVIEDVRAAWYWAAEHGDYPAILRSIDSLLHYYLIRGRLQEGVDDFEFAASSLLARLQASGKQASEVPQLASALINALAGKIMFKFNLLQVEQALPDLERLFEIASHLELQYSARAYLQTGFGVRLLGQEKMTQLYERCLAYFTEAGDWWAVGMCHFNFGEYIQFFLSNPDLPRQKFLQSLEVFRRINYRWGIALALIDLAFIAYSSGEYDLAMEYARESLQVYQALEDAWRIVNSLLYMGSVATALGNYQQAIEYYQQGLSHSRELGNRTIISRQLDSIGYVQFRLGEYRLAEQNYRQSLAISRETNDPHEEGMALSNLGDIAQAQGDIQLARQRYLESLAIFNRGGMSWGKIITMKKLAHTALILGDKGEAWSRYQKSLQDALTARRYPEILEILVGLGKLAAMNGDAKQAVQLMELCLSHPAIAQDVREDALRELERLSTKRPQPQPVSTGGNETEALVQTVENLLARKTFS
jgi:predicted ATPase/DNA-binding SARP family transcriptional activator/predicted negative regulator of RcsB-dependent stress response